MNTAAVQAGSVTIGGDSPLAFIAGPCVIEDEDSVLRVAAALKQFSHDEKIPLIFKSSFDKANRSSASSFRGPGLKEGLKVLRRVKDETGLPLLSDIHSAGDAAPAAEVLDMLQIPAFLCRQTDLILAAAGTGKPVNVKKGQFISPQETKNIIEKCTATGNRNIVLTERGVMFGYNNLVVDLRAIPIMRSYGCPVVFDATHSVQLPGGMGQCSGGERQYVEVLARGAVSAGCDAVFMEVHEDPDNARCDGPNMLSLETFKALVKRLVALHGLVQGWDRDQVRS